VAPTDVTALASAKPTEISSHDPHNPAPGRSIVVHYTFHPPPHATTALQTPMPSHRGNRNKAKRNKKDKPEARCNMSAATLEGTTSTVTCEH
jgi:hypothetical protein